VQNSRREKYKEDSINSLENGTNGTKPYMKDKERFDIFMHHAWAGTALLSVLPAVRQRLKQSKGKRMTKNDRVKNRSTEEESLNCPRREAFCTTAQGILTKRSDNVNGQRT